MQPPKRMRLETHLGGRPVGSQLLVLAVQLARLAFPLLALLLLLQQPPLEVLLPRRLRDRSASSPSTRIRCQELIPLRRQSLNRLVPIEQQFFVALQFGSQGLELDFELDIFAEGLLDRRRRHLFEPLFVEMEFEFERKVVLFQLVNDLDGFGKNESVFSDQRVE